MWGFIFGGMALGAISGAFFLWTRFQKFGIVRKLSGDRKWLRRVLALIPMLIFGVFLFISPINAVIVLVHMAVYWALAELIAFVIRKLRKEAPGKEKKEAKDGRIRPYLVGIIVLCIELVYFSSGWYFAHHVAEKDYQIETTKDLGREKLRIAQITDSHIGATFDGEGFAGHLKKIQETHPDILVITGDFVDDSSTREDLYRCATALKDFEAPLGKYFVYGNHDKGYFRNRDFSADDLEAVLSDYAGVEVLTDGVKLVDDKVYIVGRNDFSNKNRVSIDKILSLLDPSKYIVVLDHQPTDFDAEANAGADLVLCGHTHGGQMLEMNLVGNLMGVNDKVYGMETRDNTTFIVSSGISDWAIGFKTGTESEFCVIDIRQK